MLLGQVLQLPEKTWTPDADPVMATLTVVAPNYTQDKFQNFCQEIQLKDDSGVSSNATVQSKYENALMSQDMVGRKARWRLKWWGNNHNIVGYCLDKMGAAQPALRDITQQPQQTPAPVYAQPATPPPYSQAPPQPVQRPNDPQMAQPRDYDAENRGKIRTQFVKAAIISGQIVIGPNCIDDLNYWTEYAMEGVAPLPPAKQQAADLLSPPAQTQLGSASYQEPPF